MSDQIWATKVSDVRTNQSFLPAENFGLQEHRDAIVESSLGRKIAPELIADQYNFMGATKLSDNLPLPPVISLAHRCVTAPFKTVIEQFDIGETFFRKTMLCDFEGQPIAVEPYWAIVVQESRETVDRAKGIEEGWMKPHPRFPEKQARLRAARHDEMPIKVLTNLRPDVDLWCDPYLTKVLFFSDRLKRALDEVPGVENFHLMPVDSNHY